MGMVMHLLALHGDNINVFSRLDLDQLANAYPFGTCWLDDIVPAAEDEFPISDWDLPEVAVNGGCILIVLGLCANCFNLS